jgi:hypothetical protein
MQGDAVGFEEIAELLNRIPELPSLAAAAAAAPVLKNRHEDRKYKHMAAWPPDIISF